MSTFNQAVSNDITNDRAGWLIRISLLSIVYYLACLTLLQAPRPPFALLANADSSFRTDTGEYRPNAAFIVLGLGGMVLTTGLYLAAPAEARFSTGLALVGIWTIATILAGKLIGASSLNVESAPYFVIKSLLCIAVTTGFMSGRLKTRHCNRAP